MEASIKILIIDDFPSMRKILSTALKKLGYQQIVEVDSPQMGWLLMQSETFDLVISNFNSPGMSGLELLSLIRKTPATKNQKFFMLTAETDKRLLMNTKNLHIDGYILKPFKLQVLADKIEALFSSSAK